MLVCVSCGYDNKKEVKVCGMCGGFEKPVAHSQNPQVQISCQDLLEPAGLMKYDFTTISKKQEVGFEKRDTLEIAEILHKSKTYSDKNFYKAQNKAKDVVKKLRTHYVEQYLQQDRAVVVGLLDPHPVHVCLLFDEQKCVMVQPVAKGLFGRDYNLRKEVPYSTLQKAHVNRFLAIDRDDLTDTLEMQLDAQSGREHLVFPDSQPQETIRKTLEVFKSRQPELGITTSREITPSFYKILKNNFSSFCLCIADDKLCYFSLNKHRQVKFSAVIESTTFAPLQDISSIHLDYQTVENVDVKVMHSEDSFGFSLGASLGLIGGGISGGSRHATSTVAAQAKRTLSYVTLSIYALNKDQHLEFHFADVNEARILANNLHQMALKLNPNAALREAWL